MSDISSLGFETDHFESGDSSLYKTAKEPSSK